MEIVTRPAARVCCLDDRQRLLLLQWRDPCDGSLLWEPPGGGIEPGEQPLDAARREFEEETGLPGGCVLDRQVVVHRDVRWNGKRYVGDEEFFLARIDHPPPLSRARLEAYEVGWLRGHAWVAPARMPQLPGRLEPHHLIDVLAALDPNSQGVTATGKRTH